MTAACAGATRRGWPCESPVIPDSPVPICVHHGAELCDHVDALRRKAGAPGQLPMRVQGRRVPPSAQAAIDRPEPGLYVGDCELCGHSLHAPRDAAGIECQRCGAYVTDLADRWERAKLKLRGYPATAAVIAGWVGEVYDVLVNRKRINDWHYRGTLRKVDDDPDTGDPRFRIGEVLDRAKQGRRRSDVRQDAHHER